MKSFIHGSGPSMMGGVMSLKNLIPRTKHTGIKIRVGNHIATDFACIAVLLSMLTIDTVIAAERNCRHEY